MIKNMGLGRQTAWVQIVFAAFTTWMTEQVGLLLCALIFSSHLDNISTYLIFLLRFSTPNCLEHSLVHFLYYCHQLILLRRPWLLYGDSMSMHNLEELCGLRAVKKWLPSPLFGTILWNQMHKASKNSCASLPYMWDRLHQTSLLIR